MARRPELLTRTWFVAKYPTGMEAVAEATFDDLAGPGRPHVDASSIRNDLAKLGHIAKKVKVYVDQHVAHAAATPTANVPTYAELVSASDAFDSLLRRYYLMIEGSSLLQTTPVKQYPFLRPLAVAWVPND